MMSTKFEIFQFQSTLRNIYFELKAVIFIILKKSMHTKREVRFLIKFNFNQSNIGKKARTNLSSTRKSEENSINLIMKSANAGR